MKKMKKLIENVKDKIYNLIENVKDIILYLINIKENICAVCVWLYIFSVINFITGTILTFTKIKSIKEFNFDNFYNLYNNAIFNKIFIVLLLILSVTYISLILYKYFTSNKKSKLINVFIIITVIFILFALLCIWIMVNYNDVRLAEKIGKIIIPNSIDSNIRPLLFLIYLGLPIIFITILLGIMSEKFYEPYLKSLIICLLVNTLGVSILALAIGIVFQIIANINIIIGFIGICILLYLFSIFFTAGLSSPSYIQVEKNQKKETKKDEPITKEFKGDIKFVKRYSINYSSDQIYSITYFGENHVCSAYEFDNKKVIIKKDGKIVDFIPRCK